MNFSPLLRKLVLLVHVITSVGFIGAVAAYLVLAIDGLAGHAVYADLRLVAWWVALPAAYLSIGVGVLSSLGTPWGLVRYWWVIAKLLLTIIAVVVLQLQMRTIDALAAAEASGTLQTAAAGKNAMVLHASGGLLVLVVITLLSVFKPRGTTKLGPHPG